MTPRPMPTMSEREIARFWSKVDRSSVDGCWPWTDKLYKGGYGRFNFRDNGRHRLILSHRVAYFLQTDDDPGELDVLHRCDFGPCCRKEHLFKGTHDDNMADMKTKGRSRNGGGHHVSPERRARGERHGSRTHPEALIRGEANNKAKLNAELVREIRRLASSGLSHPEIITTLNLPVSPVSVRNIVIGKCWKHVTYDQ